MEHLEVVSLDGAVRVESHQGIDYKEEKEGGALCVRVCVCVHMHSWNFVCHQWRHMRITREGIFINNPDRELGFIFMTSRTQPMLISFNSSLWSRHRKTYLNVCDIRKLSFWVIWGLSNLKGSFPELDIGFWDRNQWLIQGQLRKVLVWGTVDPEPNSDILWLQKPCLHDCRDLRKKTFKWATPPSCPRHLVWNELSLVWRNKTIYYNVCAN